MNNLQVTEYKDIRVLTTQQIAEVYGTDNKTISYNFNHNKNRYTEGKHYICLEGNEKIAFLNRLENHDSLKKAKTIYLWTQKGAFLHAKSLGTDKAWEVYENLVDFYFEKKKQQRPLTALEQLQLTQQAVMEVNEKIDSVDKDLQEFKQDMPVLALECERITKAKNNKIVKLLGGKDSNAYKNRSLRSKAYSDIDKQLRREFGITTYKAIKRNQCDKAIEIINNYQLPMVLEDEVKNHNAQMSFDEF